MQTGGTKVSREHASLLGQILHSFSLDDPRVNIQELIKGNCDLSYEDLEFILSQHPSTISIAQNLQRELKSSKNGSLHCMALFI